MKIPALGGELMLHMQLAEAQAQLQQLQQRGQQMEHQLRETSRLLMAILIEHGGPDMQFEIPQVPRRVTDALGQPVPALALETRANPMTGKVLVRARPPKDGERPERRLIVPG